MAKLSIFLEDDYRVYIEKKLKLPGYGRGSKAKMAELLDCKPSFVSQVLKEKNTFSLEQGFRLNTFFRHNKLEAEYFMTLLEWDRAGTFDLKAFYKEKLAALQEKAKKIENRLDHNELSEADSLAYFGNWNQVLIRQLINIPDFQRRSALKARLQLTDEELDKALNFLLEKGLIKKEGSNFVMGDKKLHIPKSSPVSQFANVKARLESIRRLDLNNDNAFNFGAQITMSEDLYKEFMENLKNLISDLSKKITNDNPEKLCSLIIDFIEVN